MLSLSIQHLIHLTREQRYALHEGEAQTVIGVSVPVWFTSKATSEPAKEVFCEYHLTNPRKDLPISILEKGYEIPLPYRPGSLVNLTQEQWRQLNLDSPEKLDEIYQQTVPEISSINLLEPIDGGSGSLTYRENAKLVRGDNELAVFHHVNIGRIEDLFASID